VIAIELTVIREMEASYVKAVLSLMASTGFVKRTLWLFSTFVSCTPSLAISDPNQLLGRYSDFLKAKVDAQAGPTCMV
jgi:hypothetical protein